MTLPYLDETLLSPDGIRCRVLDVARIDFAGAVTGRKAAETLVRRARGGEDITTRNAEGKVENTYVARTGDAIFINLHNRSDIYVPGNADGTRWQFDELEAKGYIILGEDAQNGGIRVKNGAAARLLHEAVREASCIADAWGPGKHQFLFEGATLKLNDDGRITGIDKSAFDATWELTAPAAPRAAGRTGKAPRP